MLHHKVRALIHLPIGIINALLFWQIAPVGWALFIGFLVYELAEDWRIHDLAYIDLQGFLIGLGGCGLALVLIC